MFEENTTNFDIYNQALTNEELVITYTPSSNTKTYKYQIIKDKEVYKEEVVSSNEAALITLYETGDYQINVTTFDKYNRTSTETSGIYQLDFEAPSIVCTNSIIEITQTKDSSKIENDLVKNCQAKDNKDEVLTNQITWNLYELNLNEPGLQTLTYSVSDSAGNTATKNVSLNVMKDNTATLLLFRASLILVLVILFIQFMRYRRSMKIERRLTKYSIEAINDRRTSLFGSFMKRYQYLIKKSSIILKKSVFIDKYSKRYEKYVTLYRDVFQSPMDCVSTKVFSSILLLIVAVLSKTIQSEVMSLYEIFIPMLFGFFIPDIVFLSRYKLHRNRLENDLLSAIIIMNNAFKSGRSITQAIELVTKELDGPIAEEFKKMYLEISFGLGIEVVFKRFSERIELEEVSYLTASLSILNRTGGNIIKVFTSIEKTLFNKKKLKLELASLTGSSKIIVYLLIGIPLMFVVFISLISPSYFEAFYTTSLGFILLGIILIIYILYIIVVRKIMKVRM